MLEAFKLLKVDEIHLVDGSGKQIISDVQNDKSIFGIILFIICCSLVSIFSLIMQ